MLHICNFSTSGDSVQLHGRDVESVHVCERQSGAVKKQGRLVPRVSKRRERGYWDCLVGTLSLSLTILHLLTSLFTPAGNGIHVSCPYIPDHENLVQNFIQIVIVTCRS